MEMRKFFSNELEKYMIQNSNIVVLNADLAKPNGFQDLSIKYPDRVFNVGIAEQNMACMAAGMSSETGAIILHVRDINAREKLLINSMAEVIVPGYATPVEFYAPDYSVTNDKSKKDNRTTIAWVPSLQSNSLGDASTLFWTADRQSDYRVIIEGITAEGELLHNELILRSK